MSRRAVVIDGATLTPDTVAVVARESVAVELADAARRLFAAAEPVLDPSLDDRPLHPDLEAARALVAAWDPGGNRR